MRRRSLAGLTAIAVTGGTLLATGAPAQADDPMILYVKQADANCSDQGPGSDDTPFCTIGAAAAVVTAPGAVLVEGGNYAERVTLTSSGIPEAQISFMAWNARTPVTLVGPNAGLVIDGQHDIYVQEFNVSGSTDVPAIDLRNASNIMIAGGKFTMANVATAPAIRLANVRVAALEHLTVSGTALAGGVTMDASTSEVIIDDTLVSTDPKHVAADDGVGIRIDGPHNTILGGDVAGFSGAAISVGPTASATVIANNRIRGGIGYGIHNRGAAGTSIANNDIQDRCLGGVRVDGTSSQISVQNNVLRNNGAFSQGYCDPQVSEGIEIGVYDEALSGTVIDYNNTWHQSTSATSYSWNGTRMGLTQFRTVSGQAAHDRYTWDVRDNVDSANSTAPGYQDLDTDGKPRRDDPAVPNTGVGPIAYADRGTAEAVRHPVASFDATVDLGTSTVRVDASASTPGFTPIDFYEFRWGDGTSVTQSTPIATHKYAKPGTYDVTVSPRGTDGLSGSSTEQVSVLRRTASVGLLALSNLRYVGAAPMRPNQVGLTASAQYDLADAGNGQVALVARANGRYVAQLVDGTLNAESQVVGASETFTVVRNSDGTVSLKASNNLYATADPSGALTLSASRPTINTWEKFHQVPVADANRSLKANVNSRFVMADGAGVKPLIASQTAASTWERFDIADLGNGQIALFARANNRFVSADGAGSKPLIANAPAASTWERFTMVRNSDGSVSFKATVNNKYASADGAGSKPLIANGPAISTWEKFTLG
ncbi:right-handed parallel beta-helix repeat-containing protein [Micromonospora foliorum]|uniref:right-handed parallel beta-helix repeat-containing protein n=1 Tax=Micromonospora foliorum TaxID=2911210 RepID=UPI001EE9096E|nr:right-handed parallel beta-helix repeat-containing protein [Micromonospora foliorum]MCG5438513.1 right-handed parallel beta-helix repeat-containing protein [Micromonospora foliorum]